MRLWNHASHKGSDWADYLSVITLLWGYGRLSGPQFRSEMREGVLRCQSLSDVCTVVCARHEDRATETDDYKSQRINLMSMKMHLLNSDVARCVARRNNKGLDRVWTLSHRSESVDKCIHLSGLTQYTLLHFRSLQCPFVLSSLCQW